MIRAITNILSCQVNGKSGQLGNLSAIDDVFRFYSGYFLYFSMKVSGGQGYSSCVALMLMK